MPEAELKDCVTALLYIESKDILTHSEYIKSKMFDLYKRYYEKYNSIVASAFRDAICYIDSVEYFNR